MRYHLAARFARRMELCDYRKQLVSIGDIVTSRWLDFDEKPEWTPQIARADFDDLMAADAVIVFTETPNTISTTGGRHVEFGLALAGDKGVMIVGPRENVFHYLVPNFQVFATWNEAFASIKRYVQLQRKFNPNTDLQPTKVYPKLRGSKKQAAEEPGKPDKFSVRNSFE
jgi:hypothetical protein